jgi:hypothetical protein
MYLQQQVETPNSLLRQGALTRHVESVHLGHDLGRLTSANRRTGEGSDSPGQNADQATRHRPQLAENHSPYGNACPSQGDGYVVGSTQRHGADAPDPGLAVDGDDTGYWSYIPVRSSKLQEITVRKIHLPPSTPKESFSSLTPGDTPQLHPPNISPSPAGPAHRQSISKECAARIVADTSDRGISPECLLDEKKHLWQHLRYYDSPLSLSP